MPGSGAVRWAEPAMLCRRVACSGPLPPQSGRGREREYCTDSCRVLDAQDRRRLRESIELAALLVDSSESARISALRRLSDGARRLLLAELGGP